MSAKIEFALDSKQNYIHINEASKDERYFCIDCSNPLIVRKGNIRDHHFAHKNESWCSQETVLHKMAKEEIKKMKYFSGGKYNNEKIEKIELEKYYKGIRPDAIIYLENKDIVFIEFYVTHKVDVSKIRIIVENKIPTLELDLNKIQDKYIYDFISNPNNYNWIYRGDGNGPDLWYQETITSDQNSINPKDIKIEIKNQVLSVKIDAYIKEFEYKGIKYYSIYVLDNNGREIQLKERTKYSKEDLKWFIKNKTWNIL